MDTAHALIFFSYRVYVEMSSNMGLWIAPSPRSLQKWKSIQALKQRNDYSIKKVKFSLWFF